MIHKLGHYELISELGRGGMGVVFKALDTQLERQVAIKLLGRQIADDPMLIARFKREAKSAASLNHPNIVQVYFIGEENGQHYFAMELVLGESLSAILKREKKLSPQRAAHLLWQAASGLAAAHDHKIIHRDIKPGNLMLAESGLVKIADFGIAYVPDINQKLTATGQFMGTPGYVPPEVCTGQSVDHRSDIFSLGVVYYEMLAGVTPFQSDSPYELLHKVVKTEIPDIRELNSEIDAESHRILDKMLRKDKAQRYQNCHDLAADLAAGPLAGMRLSATTPRAIFPPIKAASPATMETEMMTPPNFEAETIRDLSRATPPPPPAQALQPPPPPADSRPVEQPSAARRPPVPPPNQVEPPHITARPAARKRSLWPMIAALLLIPALIAGSYYVYTTTRGKKTEHQLTENADDPNQSADLDQETLANVDSDQYPTETLSENDTSLTDHDRSNQPESVVLDSADTPSDDTAVQVHGERLADDGVKTASGATENSLDDKKGEARPPAISELNTPTTRVAGAGSARGNIVNTRGNRDGQAQPLAVNKRAPAPGGPSMVAVWATGDPVFATHMEEALESFLGQEKLSLMKEKGALTLDPFRDEPRPAIDRLGSVLHGLGAEVMVLAELKFSGDREIRYGNRRSIATDAQVEIRCFRLSDFQPLGEIWRKDVTYTSLNAKIKAEEAVRQISGEIGAMLKR